MNYKTNFLLLKTKSTILFVVKKNDYIRKKLAINGF